MEAMASTYWRTNHTVENLLDKPDVNWEFLQLVNVLLLTAESLSSANDANVVDILAEKVEFIASLASDFPPGDIRDIRLDELNRKTSVVLSNGALSTQDGPLPEPFVAWVKELSANGDDSMAAFLNVFNHHLAVLRYIVCRSTRPTLINSHALENESGQLFQALSGVFFNRIAESADIFLSGLLANNRLSLPVLEKLLWFSEGLKVKEVNPYKGGWIRVDDEDHSRLGQQSTCALGKTSVLGKKIWDQHKSIELIFDEINWQKAKDIIPGGIGYKRFCHLIRRITDCRFDCHIIFRLKRKQIPETALIKGFHEPVEKMRLGTSAMLSMQSEKKENSTVDINFTVPAEIH